MREDALKTRYSQPAVVIAAEQAAVEIGLTVAEESWYRLHLSFEGAVIDAGCGAGRVALGLWELGHRGAVGVDFSREMVSAARQLARRLEYEVPFRVGDLRKLKFDAGLFDAVVTDAATWADWAEAGGLEDIARELARVVRPGGRWLGQGAGVDRMNLPGWRIVTATAENEVSPPCWRADRD